MNRLKRTLVLVVVLCFIPATNVYADKMKHRITTIDDVKEFRTLVIKRMNTKLESDNTNKKQTAFLKKKIVRLENKPLPTQEQIDWRNTQKRKVRHKRRI